MSRDRRRGRRALWQADGMRVLAALALALTCACSSPQRPKPDACADAAANVRAQFEAMLRARQQPDVPETAGRVEAVITERCRADAWSPEAIACLSRASSDDQLERCAEDVLTDDQERALEQAIDAIFSPNAGDRATKGGPSDDAEGGSGARGLGDPCGGGEDGATHDPCGGGE